MSESDETSVTADADTATAEASPQEAEVSVEYARYGSERLRSFFSFFGITSALDEKSRPEGNHK